MPVRKALPPLREVQFPQRSVGTFLIIVITTISRGADNPVWALCFKPSSTASLEPGAGGTWAEVLSPILQMWPLRSVGFQILLPRHQLGCGGWERVLGFQRLTLEVQGGGIISWGGGVATFQVWGGSLRSHVQGDDQLCFSARSTPHKEVWPSHLPCQGLADID